MTKTLLGGICLLGLSASLMIGCEEKETHVGMAPEEPVATSPETTTEDGKPAEQEAVAAGDKIEVTAEGGKIDPPVAKDKIPVGAYFCDMGTVHYARMDKGDGKCPECGMMLKQMTADGSQGASLDGVKVAAAACACTGDTKCDACQKAGEACTCGTDTPCEICEGCKGAAGAAGAVAADHACDHPAGEACDCGHHGEKKEDGAGEHAGHGH